MKRAQFALCVLILVALGSAGRQRAVASGDTIPMWSYTVTSSRDGKTYTGTMVGASPFTNPNSTTVIPTQIVPLNIHMSDGGIFDPTAPDPCLAAPFTGTSDLTMFQQSPIFQNHAYAMNGIDVGTTQYLDAFQRANFWSVVGGQAYHTLLSPTTLSPMTVSVPPGKGHTDVVFGRPPCRNAGSLDGTWFDQLVTSTLLPALAGQGVNPTTLPIFLVSEIRFYSCPLQVDCGDGYHGAIGSPSQTYIAASFNTVSGWDAHTVAREVGDWMTDPLSANSTPPWGHIGAVGDCQATLKAGAPLKFAPLGGGVFGHDGRGDDAQRLHLPSTRVSLLLVVPRRSVPWSRRPVLQQRDLPWGCQVVPARRRTPRSAWRRGRRWENRSDLGGTLKQVTSRHGGWLA